MVLEWILLVGSILTGLGVLYGKLSHKAEGQSFIADYGRALFPVIIIVFAVRSFVVEPFRIPSGSMLPTLHLGDFILVNKNAYGIKLPITYKKVLATGSPERGDVVVFRYPKNLQLNYIKRLVGLPGDKLRMQGRRLFINDQEVPTSLIQSQHLARDLGRSYTATQMQETLDEVQHDILLGKSNRTKDFELVVPAGHYFVMGDNRDNSSDSRIWGFVPEKNMVGRAFFIWFSWNVVAGGGVDWERMGKSIE